MARRKSVSDTPEALGLPTILERSPLLDPRDQELRSCPTQQSGVYRFAFKDPRSTHHRPGTNSSRARSKSLMTIAEDRAALRPRSRSATHSHRSSPQVHPFLIRASPQHPSQFRSSPQYRVNPAVKFDERLFPERMNFGIAGYNTSRPRSASESKSLIRIRPKSLSIWRLWTRRFRERMIRIRIRDACSRLLSRIRRISIHEKTFHLQKHLI